MEFITDLLHLLVFFAFYSSDIVKLSTIFIAKLLYLLAKIFKLAISLLQTSLHQFIIFDQVINLCIALGFHLIQFSRRLKLLELKTFI